MKTLVKRPVSHLPYLKPSIRTYRLVKPTSIRFHITESVRASVTKCRAHKLGYLREVKVTKQLFCLICNLC